MAHITALNFCSVGFSLFLLFASRKQALWPQILSLLTGLSALLAIVGYIYRAPLLYGSTRNSSMALHTGAGFSLLSTSILSTSILFYRPSDGLMAAVTSPNPGGWLSRKLIPLAFFIPIALGSICIHFGSSLTDVRLALACLVVTQVILFVGCSGH